MFLRVRHSLLDHPGHLALDLCLNLTHLKARLGWSPFVASSLTDVVAGFSSLWAIIGHLTSFKSCGGNFLS